MSFNKIMFYLFLIPVVGALIGWMVAYILIKLITQQLLSQNQTQIKANLLQILDREFCGSNPLAEKIKTLDLEKEIVPLLDPRLEYLVDNLKDYLPLAFIGDFLISPPMRQRFKDRARKEILSALPLIKEKLAQRIEENFDLKAMIANKIQAFDFSQLIHDWLQDSQRDLMKLKGLGALIGLGLGLIEFILIYIINLYF